jgi:outer membrane cobalamin receptor
VDQNVAVSPTATIQFGSDVIHYGGRARNVVQSLDYGSHHISTAAGFLRGQWMPSTRVRLHAGGRYEHNSQFGSVTAPEFGASVTLGKGYVVAAEAGKGFRNPTIRELYLFPAPNPNLRPERLWNYQLSLQARPLRSLATTFTGYYADLSNLIVVTGRFPTLQLQNAGVAPNRGIETTARWQAARRLTMHGGYAYLRSTNLTPYVPAHKLNYGTEMNLSRVLLYFGGMSVGRRFANAQHTQQLDGYNLGTVKMTLPVRERFQVFTLVDNVFNRRYEVIPDYPMPRINASGGISVAF